jgi:uncharacterized protein (TIGR03435 family)
LRARSFALALSASIGAALALSAQTAPAKLEFEVASIKPSPPSGGPRTVSRKGGPGTGDPTRVVIQNYALESLILDAYEIQTYQLAGPDWLIGAFGPTALRFDVDAKVPEGTTKEQFQQMFQNLLADRFELALHHETREMPVYDLVIAKSGPKLTPSPQTPAPAPPAPDDSSRPSSAPRMTLGSDGYPVLGPGDSMAIMGGRGRMRGANETMARFAGWLSAQFHRPVNNATGLTGEYDFILSWEFNEDAASASGEPTLPEALQLQLGLRLESKKGPADILVIDHIERSPTEN